jgi:hypothetical protein
MLLKVSSKFNPKRYLGKSNAFAQIKKDIPINKRICFLFLVMDKESTIPIGIDNSGVIIAIPGNPKFLLNFTKNLLFLLKSTL